MAAPEQYENDHEEILKRVRRIETRQMKMAEHLGLDPTKGRDRITQVANAPIVLDVSGLDVSIGDLVDFCRKSGITRTVLLECRGRLLGEFIVGADNGMQKRVAGSESGAVVSGRAGTGD